MPLAARLLAQVVPLRRARYPLSSSNSCCCQYKGSGETRSSSSISRDSSNDRSDHGAHGSPPRRRALPTAATPLIPFYPSRSASPTTGAATALATSAPAPFFPGFVPSRPTAASSFPFTTATRVRRTAFPRHGKAVEPVPRKLPGTSRRHRKPAVGVTAAVPAAEEEEEEEEPAGDGEAQTGAEAEAGAEKGSATQAPAEMSEIRSSSSGNSVKGLPATPMPFSSAPVNGEPPAPGGPRPVASPALDAVTGGEAAAGAAAAAAAVASATPTATTTEFSAIPSLRPLVIELGPPTTGTGSEQGQARAGGEATGPDAKAQAGARPGPGVPRDPPKALKPYVHHFDSYSLVKQLQEAGGYSQAQAITAMKAVRALLAQHLQVAQASLVSKSDVDNETYLFQAASAELRIEVRNNRRRADEQVRQQRALLQHEVDIASQAIGQELVSLNDVVRGLFDDRKMAVREEQRALESKIQQLSYKIATDLNSEMRSEIEGMRWVMIWRAVLGILFMGVLTMVMLRYARYRGRQKQKQAETHAAATAAATAAAAAAAAAGARAEARAADAGRPPDAAEVPAVHH